MPLNSYTGRQDPSARYEPKAPKEKRLQSYRDFDVSTLGDLSLETEGEDFTVPNQPDPVTPTMPAVQAASVSSPSANAQAPIQQTEMERINNLGDALLEEEDSQFTRGAIAGTQQMLGLYGGAKATLGALIDNPEMVESGLGFYQEKMREAEKFSPNVGTLEEIDLSLDGGMERLGDYLGYTIGNVLPSIAISLGTGGVTGIVAGTAAKYLGKEGAKEALEALAKKQIKDQTTLGSEGLSNALKKLRLKDRDFDTAANDRLQELIREDMEGAVAKEAANRAKQDYISQQAYKYGLLGSGSQSVTLNTGENFGEIYERTGVQAPGTAIAAGIAAGALDTFAVPLRVAKQLTPDMLEPLKDFLSAEALQKSGAIERVLKEVGKTSGIEGMTEATQVMITEMAVTFANNNFTDQQKIEYLEALSNEETRSKVMNAAAAGLIGGFAVSGVTAPIAEGVNTLRGREPEPSVRDALIQDTENRLQAMRDSVREIVEAEFTEDSGAALPAPEGSDTQQVAITQQPEVESNIVDTLETIDLSAGITAQELAGEMFETAENQQNLLTAMVAEGLVIEDTSGGATTYSVSDKGSMILYPPEEVDEGLVDLPPVPQPVSSTTTVETEESTTTTTQTLDEVREEAAVVSEEAPQTEVAATRTRTEPTMSSRIEGRGTTDATAPVVSPLIGPVDNKPLNDSDPFVSPLTDKNRVVTKPKIRQGSDSIGRQVTEVSFPDSGTKYEMKQYATDAGGGFYASSQTIPELGKNDSGMDNIDLGKDRISAIRTLTDIERQRASTAVQTPVVEEAPVEGVADPVAEAAPIVEDPIQRNAETLTDMAEYAGWEIIGGKGIVGPEGESLGRSPWVARSEWFQQAQKDGNLGGNTNGDATRRVVAKAIAGKKLGVAEQRHIDSMLGYLADLELMEQSQQSSVIADLSQEGVGVTVTELEYDDALAGITLGDTNRLELPVWGEMTDSERDAELNNIFGEPDGRETNATQREAEARTAISDRRKNATNERELATVRQGDVTEDTGRESGQAEGRVSQPDANPKPKRNVDNEDHLDLIYPDGDVRTIRQEDGVWYDVNTDLELGEKRKEAIDQVKLIRQEEFAVSGGAVAAAPQELRVKDPSLDAKKSTKKDENFQSNGEHIVSFGDGDQRRMFYDAESRGWYNSERIGADARGLDGYLGGNKKEALQQFKVIRQREFDEAAKPSDMAAVQLPRGSTEREASKTANLPIGTLTGAGALRGEPQSDIKKRLTRVNLGKGKTTYMLDTQDQFERQAFGSMSKLMGVLGIGQPPTESPVVTSSETGEKVTLSTFISEGIAASNSIDADPSVAQIVNTLLDLSERGMPSVFLNNTQGIYSNPHRAGVLGSFYPSTFSMSIDPELVRGATIDQETRRQLAHVMAHEHWHLADYINNYSARLPEFDVSINTAAGSLVQTYASNTFNLKFGDAVQETYDAWSADTEFGQEFNYPFSIMGDLVNDAFLNTDNRYEESVSAEKRVGDALQTIQKEVFAQAGAVFIGNPKLLKDNAPAIYDIFRAIQANPEKTAGQLEYGQRNDFGEEQSKSGGGSLQEDFRSQSVNRGVQIPFTGGTGPAGTGGGGQRSAGDGLAGSIQDPDRDSSGPSLRDTPSLDIRGDQKYLYQKPRGKVRGKSAITKEVNPKNADKQLPLLSELVARHTKVLDSAANWTAFEKDLTGGSLEVTAGKVKTKETLVLRPPHYLIKLYNDMDLWVETHSKLRGDQLAAANAGLKTAQRMGQLYSKGAATPEHTAKLMLWGMLSRMLTASAQESAFVDLMTKSLGQNFDPFSDLVQKTLEGNFSDEMVTRTVVTDESKGTTKEVTSNRDVADWRDSVREMIPAGSFGKAGTSNSNDFAKFMLKMSELDEVNGQSKLATLHDLVSDRSISTAEVRRQFQGMNEKIGIDNKVFSFLMLMTGRDDVVILDRIQLNTMWDSGRYGKLIYDDIAGNFSGLHGLARYEVMENALQDKIVELYTRLGRPQDASVGRYHWESWVLNSGQVVAHPTMQGLVDDIEGASSPYAFMGAPEGKQNMFRYGAIYARDDKGKQYFMYSDSNGQPYKFNKENFRLFLDEIKKPKVGILPKNFKVSEYDQGYPWYEAEGVDRAKLDEVIKSFAQGKATPREYGVEGDVLDEGQADESGTGLGPTPSLDMANTPAFREAPDSLATRNRLVDDLEKAGIPQGELVADITDQDLDAMSPDSKRLLKALRDDDWLGFDNIDDLLLTVFDEGLDGYETSISTRIALGRYVNQNYGGVSSALDMLGDDPNKTPSSKFNEEDAADVVKDLQYRLEKILPFYRGIMDQYVDMKQLERKIAAAKGIERLPADKSFYDAENLMHGKAAYELDLVQKKYLEPIIKILSSKKIDVEGLGKYLLAKHAPERNAVIAQKAVEKREKLVASAEKAENQRLIDYYEETPIPFQNYETEQGGSGISNQEAIEILTIAGVDGLTATMDEASQLIYDMLKEHRDRMIKNQLLDFETVEDWEGQYRYYVPLKGFAAEENIESDYTMSGKTRGFSITGSESLKAKGRTTLPANPVVISILDVAEKIKRGEKNKVSNVLLDMLLNSGFEIDPEINEKEGKVPWTIWNNKSRPADKATDGGEKIPLTQMDNQKRLNGDPRFIRVKRGGQTFFIEFKDDDINRVLQKLGESTFNMSSQTGKNLVSTFNGLQNFRRNVLINYNPAWGLVNPLRDIVTAIPYAMSEAGAKGSRTDGKDVTAKMIYNYPNALRAYWRHLRETEGRGRSFTARGSAKQSAYDQYVKEYFEDGAPTGMILTRTYEEEVRAIENQIKGGNIRGGLKSLGKFVEDFNQTMENAARVSAYVEARKAGAPRANSASLAKDLTVNFNRKGEISAFVNLLYLFFNAAQQGTQNFIQAAGRGGKKVPAFLMGLFGAGYTITVYNILTSDMDDDDEVKYDDYNDSQLKRSINIAKEDGTMAVFPLAYSYQFFYNAGRVMAELQYELKDEGEAFTQIWQSFIDNFSPLDTQEGEGYERLRGFAPDLVELLGDLIANKDFFGNPIQREQFPTEPKKAQAYVTKRSTSQLAKDVIQRINDLDGDEITDSAYYPTSYLAPDQVDYIAAWILGGVGRFVGDISDVAYKAATDPEAIEFTDYPIVGQFYKEPSKYKDQMEFYENSDRYASLLYQLDSVDMNEDGRISAEEYQARPELKRREPYYSAQLQLTYKASNKALRELRKREKAAEKYIVEPSELRLKLQEIDVTKQRVFDSFNKAFREAKRKAGD